MSGDKKPPIIKKIIKKSHGGHHGGSWKVAYADFVTALMAFFLVMWLLAISSEAGREALADYFNELTMTDAVFNGGMPSAFDESKAKPSILDGGCFSPKTEGDATINTETDSAALQAQMAALLATTQTLLENLESLPEGVDGGEGSGDAGRAESSGTPLNAEEQQFSDSLVSEIKGSLGDAAAGQVTVEKVKGGLRIQIVDKEGRPMFKSGGPTLTNEAKGILSIVGERLRSVPNKISIEGHTDALAFSGQRMTNWELSTARASAARMYLSQMGVRDDRVTMVVGYAATQPLPKTDPNDPINRRISIMIWDEEPAPSIAPPGTRRNGQTPEVSAPGNSGAKRSAVTPPPLPKTPATGQRAGKRPTAGRPLTGEELENQLIESTMEKAASPDLSTVGPAVSPAPGQ